MPSVSYPPHPTWKEDLKSIELTICKKADMHKNTFTQMRLSFWSEASPPSPLPQTGPWTVYWISMRNFQIPLPLTLTLLQFRLEFEFGEWNRNKEKGRVGKVKSKVLLRPFQRNLHNYSKLCFKSNLAIPIPSILLHSELLLSYLFVAAFEECFSFSGNSFILTKFFPIRISGLTCIFYRYCVWI
jgi:hypothetical protein